MAPPAGRGSLRVFTRPHVRGARHNKDTVSDGSCKLFYFEYTGKKIYKQEALFYGSFKECFVFTKKFFFVIKSTS